MSKKAIITCSCRLEIENVNEYEALDIVNEMLKREYPLSEKVILPPLLPALPGLFLLEPFFLSLGLAGV